MEFLMWVADHAVLVWGIICVILLLLIVFRWNWIKQNKEYASALGTIAALIVTSAFATLQPAMTRIALQNSLIYQMQKDTRSTAIEFRGGKAMSADLFAVMQSIYVQYQLGSINGYAWPVFLRDFCAVMAEEKMRREWQDEKGLFAPDFSAFIDKIAEPHSTYCS